MWQSAAGFIKKGVGRVAGSIDYISKRIVDFFIKVVNKYRTKNKRWPLLYGAACGG
jgi:hypothetical protein